MPRPLSPKRGDVKRIGYIMDYTETLRPHMVEYAIWTGLKDIREQWDWDLGVEWIMFQASIHHCKAILYRGQPGLMRLILCMNQVQNWSPNLLTCSPACYHCATTAQVLRSRIYEYIYSWNHMGSLMCITMDTSYSKCPILSALYNSLQKRKPYPMQTWDVILFLFLLISLISFGISKFWHATKTRKNKKGKQEGKTAHRKLVIPTQPSCVSSAFQSGVFNPMWE